MQKEQNLYSNFVTALINSLQNDYFKASLLIKPSFRQEFVKQINYLFTLEKEFNCVINREPYSLVMAQTLANLIHTKTTIEKLNKADFAILDAAYIDYVSFVSNETPLSKADLKEPINNITPSLVKDLVKNFDSSKADDVLAQFENQGTNTTSATNPKAQVKRDEAHVNNTNSQTGPAAAAAGGAGGTGMGMGGQAGGFNPYMGGGMPFMGPDFPVHPRFDARFYPFTKKLKWMPNWKFGLAICTIISCAFLFIITLVARYSPITLPLWIFQSGAHEGSLALPNTSGATFEQNAKFILSPSGVGLISGLFSIIPALWIGYSMLARPKMPAHRYYMSPLTLGANIIFLGFTTYYLINFLLPNYIFNLISNAIYSTQSKTAITDYANKLTSQITNSSIYKAIYTCTIVSLSLVAFNVCLLIASLIINPRIDQQKLMRANSEYQKAIEAKFQNKKYTIDPDLYDPELTEEYNQAQKAARGET